MKSGQYLSSCVIRGFFMSSNWDWRKELFSRVMDLSRIFIYYRSFFIGKNFMFTQIKGTYKRERKGNSFPVKRGWCENRGVWCDFGFASEFHRRPFLQSFFVHPRNVSHKSEEFWYSLIPTTPSSLPSSLLYPWKFTLPPLLSQEVTILVPRNPSPDSRFNRSLLLGVNGRRNVNLVSRDWDGERVR